MVHASDILPAIDLDFQACCASRRRTQSRCHQVVCILRTSHQTGQCKLLPYKGLVIPSNFRVPIESDFPPGSLRGKVHAHLREVSIQWQKFPYLSANFHIQLSHGHGHLNPRVQDDSLHD